MRTFTGLLTILVILLTAAAQAAAQPIILGLSNKEADTRRAEFLNYDRFRKALLQNDIMADLLKEPVSLNEAREFHVIFYPTHEEMSIRNLDDPQVQATIAAERRALEEFVREGGGLVILLVGVRYPGDIIEEYYNMLFAGFGLRIMHEGIWDPQTTFTAPHTPSYGAQEYFMVTNFLEHEITRGIERLALPKYRYSTIPGVEAVEYDENWTAVVSGNDTARSYFVHPQTNLMDDEQPGTYESTPPIMAVRQFGQGRIVAYNVPPIYTYLNLDNPLWPHTTERAGNPATGEASHGQKLLENAFWWAAAPAQEVAALGTRTIPERVERVVFPERMEVAPPPGAPDALTPLPAREHYRGIKGARTAYSDGEGTVEEWAAAARAAGLDFIVFGEDLTRLTPEKWEALVEDCRRISAEGDIYLCPGYEFSDIHGTPRAIWGERVIYPDADMFGPDGKQVFKYGDLAVRCNFAPNMVLDYSKLPGDWSNQWWYYRVPVFVYDEDRLVAENLDAYLFGIDNLNLLGVSCWTRIRSPRSVAAAAARGMLSIHPMSTPREDINTRCSRQSHPRFISQGGPDGPRIDIFSCSNRQSDANVYDTAGTQRARLYFRVTAPAGLRDIRIHNGTRGLARRFDPAGATEFAQEFELPHDRQYELVLEAEDAEGRRAIWSQLRMFSYKQGFFRCGDNLNILGSTPIVTHPDRHEYPQFAKFEDTDLLSIMGFDTGVGILTMPAGHLFPVRLLTSQGRQEPYREEEKPFDSGRRVYQKPARFPLAGNEISIWDVDTERYVKWLESRVSFGPFLPAAEELPFATMHRRVYMLRSRMNYYVMWDHRRPNEGSEEYRGTAFLHELTFRFKQDVTLEGAIPISLLGVELIAWPNIGMADTFAASDKDKGEVRMQMALGERPAGQGVIPRGGYITGYPTDAGAFAVMPVSGDMTYSLVPRGEDGETLRWAFMVGGGEAGREVRAGEEITFSYLAITLPAKVEPSPETFTAIAAGFGLGGEEYAVEPEVGSVVSREVFLHLQAENGEFAGRIGPQEMFINRPLRVSGLVDNNTAAVYVHEGLPRQQRFRFVPVVDGDALAQQETDGGVRLWVGNVFLADHPALRLTLVMDGLQADEQPFLEVHNPTGETVQSRLRSPANTPHFGGWIHDTVIPAGSSIRIPL